MKLRIVSTLLVMLLSLSTTHAQQQQAVELEAADGVKVFARRLQPG